MLPFPEATPDHDLSDLRPGDVFNPFRIFNGIFIPDPIMDFPDLTPTEKLAYGVLARFCGRDGRCFPSVPTIASRLGISDRQTRNVLSALTDRRLILRVHEAGKVYCYFLWHESFEGRTRQRSAEDQEGQGVEIHFRGGRKWISGAINEEINSKETATTARAVVASPGERGSTTRTPPESSNQPHPPNIPTLEPIKADPPTSGNGGDVSPDRPTEPDTGETGRHDGGENSEGQEVVSGPEGDITKSNVESEIRQLKAKSESETEAGSPNPEAPDQHPDTDPVDRAIASIRDDLKTTAGIRRVIEKGIERYGEERVIRNIGYCNQTGKSPKSYRAYLDLSIRGDWGVDFNPESEPPPDPTEAEREALKEIERRRLEVEQERQEAERIGAAFLRLPEAEQARLRAAFIDQANPFERRRAGRMTAGGLSRNISFVGFLKSRN